MCILIIYANTDVYQYFAMLAALVSPIIFIIDICIPKKYKSNQESTRTIYFMSVIIGWVVSLVIFYKIFAPDNYYWLYYLIAPLIGFVGIVIICLIMANIFYILSNELEKLQKGSNNRPPKIKIPKSIKIKKEKRPRRHLIREFYKTRKDKYCYPIEFED